MDALPKARRGVQKYLDFRMLAPDFASQPAFGSAAATRRSRAACCSAHTAVSCIRRLPAPN
jgi:hypothetical protein